VLALDDDVGAREDGLQLATADSVAVADIAVSGRQLSEPVEKARLRRPVGDERRSVRERIFDPGHDRQLLVFDLDRLHRRLGRAAAPSGRPASALPSHAAWSSCDSGELGDGLQDAAVARAAAEVAGEAPLDLLVADELAAFEESADGEEHAGRAEAALQRGVAG